jgi:peptidoglycan/xylan/chitin deacetylase (PgdA/CDA1 family)
VKATYFLVGEMARAFPATVRRIYEEGHTIGTHSEHHPTRFGQLPVERMRHEIDRGISDVSAAPGDPKYLAPFFHQWNFGHLSPGRNVSQTKTVTKPQLIFEKFDLAQLADGYAFFAWRSLTSTVIGAESGIGP